MITNPLQQLKGLHLPDAISNWPMTPAWYILAALIMVLLIFLGIFSYKIWLRRHRRRKALHTLQQFVRQYSTEPQRSLANLSSLLRRVALAKFPRRQVAGLQGIAWLNFLDSQSNTQEFAEGVGQCLISAPYQAKVDVDIHDLQKLIEHWIKGVL